MRRKEQNERYTRISLSNTFNSQWIMWPLHFLRMFTKQMRSKHKRLIQIIPTNLLVYLLCIYNIYTIEKITNFFLCTYWDTLTFAHSNKSSTYSNNFQFRPYDKIAMKFYSWQTRAREEKNHPKMAQLQLNFCISIGNMLRYHGFKCSLSIMNETLRKHLILNPSILYVNESEKDEHSQKNGIYLLLLILWFKLNLKITFYTFYNIHSIKCVKTISLWFSFNIFWSV